MKSFKEFFYLLKSFGFFNAVFYLFYKISLKLYSSEASVNYRKNKAARIEKIYAHLFVLQHKTIVINGRQLCEVPINDEKDCKVYLRPLTSDRDVFLQIFGGKDYQPVVDIYDQLFAVGPKFIVDLGCNIGLASIYFSTIYKDAVILAVEPFADNAVMAKLNMEINHVKNYQVTEGGIWNKNGMLRLHTEFRDGKEWSIRLTEDEEGTIKGYCVNDLLSSYNEPVDILKIDIEGAEKKLFENRVYAGGFLKKVKCLVMEIHDEYTCREFIYEALTANGFFYYNVNDMTIAINKNYL